MNISRRTQSTFERIDTNHNGVSKAELTAAVAEVDQDGDGQLNAAEAEALGIAVEDREMVNQALTNSATAEPVAILFPPSPSTPSTPGDTPTPEATSEAPPLSDAQLDDGAQALGISREQFRALRNTLVTARSGSPQAANMLRQLETMVDPQSSAIDRTKASALFLVHARVLGNDQRAPDELRRLVTPLNNSVDTLISRTPGLSRSPALQRIMQRYLADGANSDQRINDLASLMQVVNGETEFDLNSHGRVLFEMYLDHGADVPQAFRELLPEGARQQFDRAMERIENKMQQLTQRVGARAPQLMRDMLSSSPELSRFAWRFLTDDSVGKVAHTIDFIGELGKESNSIGRRILGESGQEFVRALHGFFELDNFRQGQLRTLLNGGAEPAARAEALQSLVRHFKDKMPQLPLREITEQATQAASRALNMGAEALESVRRGLGLTGNASPPTSPTVSDEATDLATRTGDEVAETTAETVEDAATRAAREAEERIDDLARRLNLNAETAQKLKNLTRGLSAESVANALQMVERAGADAASTVVRMLDSMPRSTVNTILSSRTVSNMVVDTVTATGRMLRSMGVSLAQHGPRLAAKLGQGVMKIIPALGGVMSAYDTARMAGMAADSNLRPEVRTLALMGAAVNGADTALAVAEAFGVGNVAFPAQLALAGTSLALDIAIEHFKENPMSPQMVQTVRRGAALAALGGVAAAPLTGGGTIGVTAALAGIWGPDVLVSELAAMGREGLAELKRMAQAGGEAARRVMQGLRELGQQGVDILKGWAQEGGRLAGQAIEGLRSMGAAGARAIQDTLRGLWNAGASGMQALADIYRNSGVQEVLSFMMNKLETAWDNSSWSNGYQGMRDLMGEMWDAAVAAGGEAMAFVHDIISHFDRHYAGDYVPDFLYSWMD